MGPWKQLDKLKKKQNSRVNHVVKLVRQLKQPITKQTHGILYHGTSERRAKI